MKKQINFILVLLILLCGLVGCKTSTKNDKTSIVTTIFPQYDWIRQIIQDEEDNYELTMLLDNGVDLHNFQPTSADIVKILTCDMFVYVGGESDSWVESVLKQVTNEDMIVINLLEVLDDNLLHEEEHDEDHDHDHEHEYDEHVWLSLKNAEIICKYLAQKLIILDSTKEEKFNTNLNSYLSELKQLDSEYQKVVSEGIYDTILFADRFPFAYLANDYGLNYYSAFSGCSAETEASFEVIVFLAGKIDELNLKTILVIDGNDKKIANTVIANTNTKDQIILEINSIQSITLSDINNGITYLAIMKSNLDVLHQALN